MRISTLQIFNIANNSMADANNALVKAQEQIATGRRVLTPSDDPVAATKILSLNNELAVIGQYENNIDIARTNLVQEENALASVNNLLQGMQELAVQAANTATLSSTEYSALASEVDSSIEELKNLMNTQNSNGDYVFGGYQSRNQPFTGNALDGFTYHGDDGDHQITVANGTTIAASDSGKSIFMDIDSVNNTINTYPSSANTSVPALSISIGQVIDQEAYDEFYPEDMVISFNQDSNISPAGKNFTITEKSTGRILVENRPYGSGEDIVINGVSVKIQGDPTSATASTHGDRLFVDSTQKQDMLTTLSRFSEAMKDFDGTPESREFLSETIAATLTNLDHAQTSVSEVTSKVGARLNTLDSIETLHTDTKLITEEFLSDLQDLDYAEAATRLSAQSLVLQAAQSSFLRVSQLSLFNQL